MSGSDCDALVIFGVTGDLAYKKIFPALQALVARGNLPIPVIGVARGGWTLARLRARVRDSLTETGDVDTSAVDRLSAQLHYVGGDYNDESTYLRLKQALSDRVRPLFYLAVAPGMFETVVNGLAKAGCVAGARVVVEKPFGRDLASARTLDRTLHAVFDEQSVFRIDHYLGKEAVQNLLYFRFANSFLEPIWNRHYVDSIQVTMAEAFGVQGRGRFYEEVGTARDVVQNHLLQLVALLTMDAPAVRDASTARAEKLRLFRAMRPIDPLSVVRGQFEGYRDEAGVSADSSVETFAACRLNIDTWRWSGVPIYLRAGKRLPMTATEVIVRLKPTPLAIFDEPAGGLSNYFRFRLSPEVVIATGTRVKQPGDDMVGESAELVARHASGDTNLPYERLLRDALRGDPALFTQDESVEAAWRVVEPMLDGTDSPADYPSGTWGPPAATTLIEDSNGWHNPAPEVSVPC